MRLDTKNSEKVFCCVNSLWSVYDDLWSLALGWAVVVGSMNFRWNILIHCDFNRLLIQQIIKLVSSTLQIQHLYERIFILQQTVTTDSNWLIWMILVLEKCILSVYPPLLHHSQQELQTSWQHENRENIECLQKCFAVQIGKVWCKFCTATSL